MTKGLRFTDNDFRKMLILALFFTFYLTTTWNRSIDVLPENVSLQTVMPQPDQEVEQLWGRPERIIPFNERKADNEIRYASFGSSVTWGSGLKDRDNEAYVKVLSKEHGDNYGIRANGPNYPASCINTMLEGKEYDVLLLEFFVVQETGMMTLAHRLRERFPDAIIVILRNWYPYMLYESGKERGLDKFKDEQGFGIDFIKDDRFHKAFLEYGKEKFQFVQFNWPDKIQYQENVARDVGAYISLMPFTEEAEGPDGYLEIGRKFMADDSFHQSAYGHADMARRVKEIVDRVGVPKNPRMGKFNDEDHCYNWLQTGVIPDKGLTYSNSFQMLQMPNTEKYTLELSDDAKQGWINVVNPVDHPMRLFVAYMTTSPAPYVYPLAEAWMESNVRVQLEPAAIGHKNKVHVPRLADMGLVNPGESRVFFRTLEKAERPFRLVQVILTMDVQGKETLNGGNWLAEGQNPE